MASDLGSGTGSGPPRMPRWVKWPAIVIGILIVVLVALRLLGVDHGPGLHAPGDPPASEEQHGGGHR